MKIILIRDGFDYFSAAVSVTIPMLLTYAGYKANSIIQARQETLELQKRRDLYLAKVFELCKSLIENRSNREAFKAGVNELLIYLDKNDDNSKRMCELLPNLDTFGSNEQIEQLSEALAKIRGKLNAK